ncbi:MAG: hypothetical protein QG608_1722 [Actinomycetota bacterium]|nr:hypothetical protein [Actinomycetota bacterium]
MRIYIWGSCVTRDSLEAREHSLDLIRYTARTSWISQASTPWPPEPDLGDTLSQFGRRLVLEDLHKKVVDQIIEAAPDVVVLDLIDDRFSLFRRGTSWLTYSDYCQASPFGKDVRAEHDQASRFLEPGRARLFETAVRAIAPRLMALAPRTKFVLHEAPYAVKVTSGSGFPKARVKESLASNALQTQLFDILAAAFGPRLERLTPPEELVRGDPNQRWGLAPFHYVSEYYQWFLDSLEAVKPFETPLDPWFPPALTHTSGPTARPVGGKEGAKIAMRAVSRRVRRLGPGS